VSERRFSIGALQASLGVLALCVGASAAAEAQTLRDDGGETVVVTAERRPKPDSAVPANSAALSGEALDFIGAQVPGEALNRTPGVAIHRNNGLENLPAIRSPVLNGGQSAGSFLVLEDGVPIRAPGFANVNQLWETSLDFAARAEVVRGPGSALYGSNAVHGLVNVLTPNLCGQCRDGFWGAQGEASGGSFGRADASVMASFGVDRPDQNGAEVSEASGPRLLIGAQARHEDGWRDASGLDQQSALARFETESFGWRIESTLALANLNQESAGFVVGTNAYKDEDLSRANPSPEAYRDTQLARGRVTLERALGGDWMLRLTP
jgi:outer membrane cobalamin receptor